jgi:hypothetical protein
MPREFVWTTRFLMYLAHCSRSSFAANSVQVNGGWSAGNGSDRVAAPKQAKIINHGLNRFIAFPLGSRQAKLVGASLDEKCHSVRGFPTAAADLRCRAR